MKSLDKRYVLYDLRVMQANVENLASQVAEATEMAPAVLAAISTAREALKKAVYLMEKENES